MAWAVDWMEAMPIAFAKGWTCRLTPCNTIRLAFSRGRMLAAILHAALPSASVAAKRTPIEASFASTFADARGLPPSPQGLRLTKLVPYVRMWNLGVCKETSLSDGTSQPSSRGRLFFLDLLLLLTFSSTCAHTKKGYLQSAISSRNWHADRR